MVLYSIRCNLSSKRSILFVQSLPKSVQRLLLLNVLLILFKNTSSTGMLTNLRSHPHNTEIVVTRILEQSLTADKTVVSDEET